MEEPSASGRTPTCPVLPRRAPVPARHSRPYLSAAAAGLHVVLSCACVFLPKAPQLPPETTAHPVTVFVQVSPAAPGQTHCPNVEAAALEEVARSLRSDLRGRRGLVIVDVPGYADVIVEILGRNETNFTLRTFCAQISAARDSRPQRWSPGTRLDTYPYRGSGSYSMGHAVGKFADDLEVLIAGSYVRLVSLRSRSLGDTAPLTPTPTAPLQGEYDLTVTASPSCAASPAGLTQGAYRADVYQHADAVLLAVREPGFEGLGRGEDDLKGQVVGDRLSLVSAYWISNSLFATRPKYPGDVWWMWDGRVTGVIREGRIDATVAGKVSLYRKGRYTDERIYACSAADHRWTLTRRK